MEEDIKILEEILKDKDWYKIHGGEDIGYPEVQAIDNLLKRYKELEEEKERLDFANKMIYENDSNYRKNSIPISVIQNKLIEAEHYINNVDVTEGQAMYKVLQELLEERNK